MKDALAEQTPSVESLVAEVADEFLEGLRDGRRPEVEDYARRYPQIAAVLRKVLPALDLLRRSAPEDGPSPLGPLADDSGRLGDFRILRQIGRGGMGIVYEAQQISLDRRVALKVLPFAAVLDPKHLQRFKNEARAAASLDHPNIVRVHSVGCERGVHYYAMQYIEGQTLAEVIQQGRGVRDEGPGTRGQGPGARGEQREARDEGRGDRGEGGTLSQREALGEHGPEPQEALDEHGPEPNMSTPAPPVKACHPTDSPPHPVTPSPRHPTDTSPLALISTEGSTRTPQFFRTIAHLGIQAAEALEHAHGMGVVHRDIKPSNLMVESRLPSPSGRGAGGEGRYGECLHLWITDFGLAMTQKETNLTMTGDLLGTLRYMSPEQVQAKHGVLDHRTDVYSLGLTLYELTTLQPAFPGDDRQKLIRQVIEDDPRPPRQLNQAIPRDLETIVLKATAKEPESRYATAQELAGDLRRFVEDRPIQARRPTPLQRAAKWARRHRAAVTATLAATIVVLVVGVALFWYGQDREARQRRRAEKNLQLALQAMDKVYLEYAEEEWRSFAGPSERKPITVEGENVLKEGMQFYRQFAESNRGESSVLLETAKAYARVGDIRDRLGMRAEAEEAWGRAEFTADEFLRTPTSREDSERLVEMYALLGRVSEAKNDSLGAVRYYSQAIQRDPDDHEVLLLRALSYVTYGMPDQAIADATEAIRIETSSGVDGHTIVQAYNVRGWAHNQKRDYDQAIADLNEAVRLSEGIAGNRDALYSNRGAVYSEKGDFDRAIADHNEAIRLDPQKAEHYVNRALAYERNNEWDRAMADYDKAIELDGKNAAAYSNRGGAWITKGELQQAMADANEAIRIAPDFPAAYNMRAVAYLRMGELDSALSDLDQAIRLRPNIAAYYINRGLCYCELGQHDRGIVDLSRAIQMDFMLGLAYRTRRLAYLRKGELDKAIADSRELVRLNPQNGAAYFSLAQVRLKMGDYAGAATVVEQACDALPPERHNSAFIADVLTSCRDLAEEDHNLTQAQRDALVKAYTTRIQQCEEPPYTPTGALAYIDLRENASHKLTDDFHGSGRRGHDLGKLPQGEQTLAGVKFIVVDCLIQLAGKPLPNRPKKVTGIPVNRRFSKVYVLQSAGWGTADGTAIGRYYVHYEDKTVRTIPIVYGEDVRNWCDELTPVTRAKVGWLGDSEAGGTICLYVSMWENPQPEKKVVSIDYVSTMSKAAPFCVAMTVEEAPSPTAHRDAELRRFRAEAEELMGIAETHHGGTEGTEKRGKTVHHGGTEDTEKRGKTVHHGGTEDTEEK